MPGGVTNGGGSVQVAKGGVNWVNGHRLTEGGDGVEVIFNGGGSSCSNGGNVSGAAGGGVWGVGSN